MSREKMFLRAVNFRWTGTRGWKGTVQWFPDNWEERWEGLMMEAEDENESESETENNGETD